MSKKKARKLDKKIARIQAAIRRLPTDAPLVPLPWVRK